jgi:hypothetical protein
LKLIPFVPPLRGSRNNVIHLLMAVTPLALNTNRILPQVRAARLAKRGAGKLKISDLSTC